MQRRRNAFDDKEGPHRPARPKRPNKQTTKQPPQVQDFKAAQYEDGYEGLLADKEERKEKGAFF